MLVHDINTGVLHREQVDDYTIYDINTGVLHKEQVDDYTVHSVRSGGIASSLCHSTIIVNIMKFYRFNKDSNPT